MADPATDGPRIHVRFLHAFCNEVAPIRRFYGELLGMTEQSAMDEEAYGWVVYQSEGLQLMFHRWDDGAIPPSDGWAWQPGDGAGDRPRLSLGIAVPEDELPAVVMRMRQAGIEAMTQHPSWRQDSYWGWTVRDPAGNTLELFATVAERPPGDPPRWPGTEVSHR